MSDFKRKIDDSQNGEGFRLKSGSYPARLVGVIDLGTQKKYQSEDTAPALFLVFETPDEKDPKGQTMKIGKQTGFTVGKKSNLRKWFGSGLKDGDTLDVTDHLGEAFLIGVDNKDGNSKIESINPPIKGMNVPDATVEPFARSITEDSPIPGWVPWCYGKPVDKVIAQSIEKGGTGGGDDEGGDDNPPF